MNNKTKKCVGKEAFQRMNYLYQVSNATIGSNNANNHLSLMYSNLVVNVAKKTVQRVGIDIKRTICKRCRCLIIPGVTAKVRVKNKNVNWTCNLCKNQRKYCITDVHHDPWPLTSEAVVEILDYSPNIVQDENKEKVKK